MLAAMKHHLSTLSFAVSQVKHSFVYTGPGTATIHPELLPSVIVVLQEKYQVQEQQATSAQASLVSLQTADLKAKHDSSIAAQAAAEQQLTHSASELRALQTEHAIQQAELASVSAERDRLTQAGASHAAELSQMQRGLSTCQVQLENSKELHRQSQEKLTAHEAGLTQLQQQYYQTGRQLLNIPTPFCLCLPSSAPSLLLTFSSCRSHHVLA